MSVFQPGDSHRPLRDIAPVTVVMMEFRVLGPIEAYSAAEEVNLGGPQQRRLLAALLCERGRVVAYDRLIEVLWPDGLAPDNARRSLITYMSRLRAVVGDDVLATTDAGYRFVAAAASIDAARFASLVEQAEGATPPAAVELLDEALGLWRGAVFGDLGGEWWARPFALGLEEQRLSAQAARIDALTVDGWTGRALSDATALVAAHPLREQFVERLMRGLHASGQTADALRTYQQYRSTLADESGLDPSNALIELERSMASGRTVTPSRAELARPLRGYVLRELLGEGSFGAVYRASQPGLGRDVAVKTVRGELADDRRFVQRFEAEAQLVARLEHPHIVPLYDFWRQPGGAYLVFRYLRGGSAEQLLSERGALPLDRVDDVVEQVGDALAAAHAAGVVHRDVKPGNILFDEAGSAYLGDFGIAAKVESSAAGDRWSAGSALYASPEQLRDGIEDEQADQYAFAVTVWELLIGRTPFTERHGQALIERKMRAPLGADDAEDLPLPIASVLARAGSVHPSHRYPGMVAFLEAWRRAVVSASIATTDPPSTGAAAPEVAGARRVARTRSSAAWAVGNPYKGLRAFREADAGNFRGRDDLVGGLVSAVRQTGFTAVVGPSGSGKSSLVQAGLLPALRAAGDTVVVVTPGAAPLDALSEALRTVARHDQADLVEPSALHAPGGVAAALGALANPTDLTVVIDQFEELWTLADDNHRATFLARLGEAIVDGGGRIVVTIRADFYDRPLADPVIGPLVANSTFAVVPMSAEELHRAIVEPAASVGVRVDPVLASRLVAESIDRPGSLPLLQFVLADLFEHRVGATVTDQQYAAVGGLAGSLGRRADALYESFDETNRAATRRLFSRLVVAGDGAEDTRRRATVSELATVPSGVVQAFVDLRLLTADHDPATREPTVEVAHEVLLRVWPRLRAWLDEDRAWLRNLSGLTAAASTWESGGRDAADLYRGARLAVASEAASSRLTELTDTERAFLNASDDASSAQARADAHRLTIERQQNSRLRRLLVGLAALLVVALVAGTIALVQRQRADREQRLASTQRAEADRQAQLATSQATEADNQRTAAQAATKTATDAQRASAIESLVNGSMVLRSSTQDLAALLAVEAYRLDPSAKTRSGLFSSFTRNPGFLGYERVAGTDVFADVTPIGNGPDALATLGDGRLAHLNLHTGTLGHVISPPRPPGTQGYHHALSGDGRIVEADFGPGDRFFWQTIDVATGRALTEPHEIPIATRTRAINHDGSLVAFGGSTAGTISVYRTADASLVGTFLANAPGQWQSSTVAFDDAGLLYVGGGSGTVTVLDPTTMRTITSHPGVDHGAEWSMAVAPDGSYAIATGTDRVERIDLPSGVVRWSFAAENASRVDKNVNQVPCFWLTLAPRTGHFYCADLFGSLVEHDVDTGAATATPFDTQAGNSADLAVTDDGNELIAPSNNTNVIARWRLDGTGPIQRTIATDYGYEVDGYDTSGRYLIVGRATKSPAPLDVDKAVWDPQTDTLVDPMDATPIAYWSNQPGVLAGAFSTPTGVVGGNYDVTTGKRLPGLDLPLDLSHGVPGVYGDATHDRFFLTHDDGTIRTYSSSGSEIGPTITVNEPRYPPAVTATADGTTLVVSSLGQGTRLYDASTGQATSTANSSWRTTVVGARDVAVAGAFDGTLELFDPKTLTSVGKLPGSRGFAQQLMLSNDASLLVVKGGDRRVAIDDIANRLEVGDPITIDPSASSSVSIRPDGKQLAIPDGHNGVVLWDLDPTRWVEAACALAGRNLTHVEWNHYLAQFGPYQATCSNYPADDNSLLSPIEGATEALLSCYRV